MKCDTDTPDVYARVHQYDTHLVFVCHTSPSPSGRPLGFWVPDLIEQGGRSRSDDSCLGKGPATHNQQPSQLALVYNKTVMGADELLSSG